MNVRKLIWEARSAGRTYGQFLGTCVGASEQSLEDYDDSEVDISYGAFRSYVGADAVRDINGEVGVPIGRDRAVSFGKGMYEGEFVVCMHHSGIHHFYAVRG